MVEPLRMHRIVRLYEGERDEFRAFYRQRLLETVLPTPTVIPTLVRNLRPIVGTEKNIYWEILVTVQREEHLPIVDRILADWATLKDRPIEGPPFVDEVQKKQRKVVKPALELKLIGRNFDWKKYRTTLRRLRFYITELERDKDQFRKVQLLMVSDVYSLRVHVAREDSENSMATLTFSLPSPEEWKDPDEFKLQLRVGLLPDLQRLRLLAKHAISLFEEGTVEVQFSHALPVDLCLECVQNRCDCSDWQASPYSLEDLIKVRYWGKELFLKWPESEKTHGPIYSDEQVTAMWDEYWHQRFGENWKEGLSDHEIHAMKDEYRRKYPND